MDATPVPVERVRELAGGIASSVEVSSASGGALRLAQAVPSGETKVSAVASTNSDETAFYVIDRGSAGGFVVLSADDRLAPVLVIAPTGRFDATPGTPLYDILCGDVQRRLARAEAGRAPRSDAWRSLLEEDDTRAMSCAYAGVASISDVRVEPLVQSRWSQSTVGGKKVYNYYTPNNYVCGCVATAGAQIMRYHRHPDGAVTPVTRTCYVNGVATSKTMQGGMYAWDDMPFVPASSISDAQCQAIGKLCYDLGVSIYMGWASGGSGTGGYCLKDAFLDVFGYKNAMALQLKSGTLSDTAVQNVLLANFDAGYPVELGIDGSYGGHSIVGDGYGYAGGSLYVHLNLGWGGSDDAWYNLPKIGTHYAFDVVDGAVYNIFPEGTGDLLTGRVLDASSGKPIAGATVQALDGSSVVGSARTSAVGVYALRLPGGKTYSVVASASGTATSTLSVFLPQSVTTRTSKRAYYPGTGTVGNSWGNDFALVRASEPVAPDAPTGVSASDGTSTAKIRVTWSASSGATYYKVYRATSNSSAAATCLASSVETLFYDDAAVDVGTTYYYWVVAGNASGESAFSASDSGYRAYAVPDAPTGVSAADGTSDAGVDVTWNAVPAATSYSVWRSTSSSASSAFKLAGGLTETAYTDTSAVAGTTYFYWVRATNAGGTSAFSLSDSGYRAVAAPAAPTGVSATDGLSSTEIVVSWQAVAAAASYSVWRATTSSSAAATQIASGLTSTAYADTSAVAGTTYFYWVKATNAGGTSAFSASDTGSLAVIAGPSAVSASDGAYAGFVRISWSASQNATAYEVWRGTVNAYSHATRIASLAAAGYDDASAQPGQLYYYWVRAVTTAGASAFSASDAGYRPLAVPAGVAATTGSPEGVTVSWAAVAGARSYQIGRGDEGASAPHATLDSATTLAYTDATAVPGVSYAYFVRAVAPACTSAWSASATGSRSVPKPTGLTASDGAYSDRILVSWPPLSGARSYELLRAAEDDISAAEPIASTAGTSYVDTTADYGLVYYYFLRANFSVGTSPWSAAEAGWRAFPAPTGVAASDGAATSRIAITWDAIAGATLYQVWRYSDARGRNELIGTSTSTSYNDSKDIEPGVKYVYRVKAVFATGMSAFSEPDAGYLKASSPAVNASDGTSTTQISLTWSASAGAVAYLVYRSASSSSAHAEQIASTSMLSYNDTSAAKGTLYAYWVRTATALDTSDFGSSDTGYRGLPGVTRVMASDGAHADKVVVTWDAVSGAKSYEIWRGPSDDASRASRVKRGVAGLSWADAEVTPGMKCWYWVRACDAGAGLWGASDAGYRTFAAPMDVSATTNQTDGVKVTWKGTAVGVSFEILRGATDDLDQASVVATISDKANYVDNSAVPGIVYYYWVRAYSELSESAWSNAARGFRAVAAPTAVAATDGESLESVTITWAASTSAKRYEIWRGATTKTDDAELIGTTNKLVWVDATALPGVAYFYWVKAVSALDTSAFSARAPGYVSTPAPTGLTASDGVATNYVRIAWTASEGALAYAVWRAESADVAAATQVKTGVAATAYDDTSVVPGRFYWYWVRPVSAAGAGVFAGGDRGFAILTAPAGVTATTNNATRVTVSWQKARGATSYELFRAETNEVADATNAVFATVTSTSYNDTDAVPAVKYWYWVRACAEADISPLAGPADGFRLLSAPTGVSATDGTSDEFVRVSWNEAAGAASYEVWRAENATAVSAATFLVGVTNALEYVDATATAGVSYTYWLKAVSDLHTTGFSARDTGWRSLPAPTGVVASDGETTAGVVVSWRAVEGAVKYEVWRGDATTTNRVFLSADASTCVYTNVNAVAGVRYWFWVRPVSAPGAGVFSLPDDGYKALMPPASVAATDGKPERVMVTWGKVAGATHYRVYRADGEEAEKTALGGWQTELAYADTSCRGGVTYWYYVVAAVDAAGSRPSAFSAGDAGYMEGGGTDVGPLDWGGGITWPVTDNGDGTATTNVLAFTSLEGGRLAFAGVAGVVGAQTTVQALVKTSLESAAVYTAPATLKVVSPGRAELDLGTVWGMRPALFVIGIAAEKGKPLP